MLRPSNLKYIKPKGEGYFCAVSEMKDESTGIKYALKKLKKKHYDNEEYRYRLLREIKLLRQLNNSNRIVNLISHGNDHENKELWYLMPLAPYNLYDFIKKNNRKISKALRFEIISQVIEAIKFAHSKSILHRDLSSNNILVFRNESDLEIKVSDFGLGKESESLSYYTKSSASGYGQILYVSPEQRNKLKDATNQSDIYSLGKLTYFILTGRDPDNVKASELSSLVSKSTEEIPSERHKDILEFENHFQALKDLIFNTNIPLDFLTLKEILQHKDSIDLIKIHELLVIGKYSSHVYSDYIEPVNSYMLTKSNLEEYYHSAGNNIRDFVKTYTERLNECYQTVRWPFSEMGTFGKVLTSIVKLVSDEETKLICLRNLWHLAYESDQWSVQPLIKEVLNKKYITTSIETQLAEYILSSDTEVDIEQFSGLDIPLIVKKSIITSHQNAIKTKKESETNRKDEINNFEW
ncbi:MAG: Serine/threonine-protein kinase PrkC [Cryomorphaceae bacterium]|jgi:serine/threonine protein kinase|nr:MAG: Serine/threonine-protein kinase PrkC [Cryomorphaceae bacterium]|tara:strand:+ start:1258 stop:2655 length:1398 start_codon:yes stop_codon:yes gene_type:complete